MENAHCGKRLRCAFWPAQSAPRYNPEAARELGIIAPSPGKQLTIATVSVGS